MKKEHLLAMEAVLLGTILVLLGIARIGSNTDFESGTRKAEGESIKVLTFFPSVSQYIALDDFYHGLCRGNELYGGNVDISLYVWQESDTLSREEYELHIVEAIQPDFVLLSSRDTALMNSGIPFLLYDGDVEDSGRLAYVGVNNEQMGRRAAQQALTLFGEEEAVHAAVIMLSEAAVFQARYEGFLCEAENGDRISVDEVCCFEWNFEKGRQAIRRMLEEQPQINLLFCEDSLAASSAAEVLEEYGAAGRVKIVGIDLNETTKSYLERGSIQVIIDQDFYQTGVDIMDVLIHRDSISLPATIYNNGRVITKEGLQ